MFEIARFDMCGSSNGDRVGKKKAILKYLKVLIILPNQNHAPHKSIVTGVTPRHPHHSQNPTKLEKVITTD